MSEKRHPLVTNRDEVTPVEITKGKHRIKIERLGTAGGSRRLGSNVTTVAPRSVSAPYHYHCATEEALFVLSGKGISRIGDARVPVRAGDWIALPTGPEYAHQMINDNDEPLSYLALSTIENADVLGYPDSSKVMAWAPKTDVPLAQATPLHRVITRVGETLDYWDGEPNAE